jgi:hypothetical protein
MEDEWEGLMRVSSQQKFGEEYAFEEKDFYDEVKFGQFKEAKIIDPSLIFQGRIYYQVDWAGCRNYQRFLILFEQPTYILIN